MTVDRWLLVVSWVVPAAIGYLRGTVRGKRQAMQHRDEVIAEQGRRLRDLEQLTGANSRVIAEFTPSLYDVQDRVAGMDTAMMALWPEYRQVRQSQRSR